MKYELIQEENGEYMFFRDDAIKHLKDCKIIADDVKLITSIEANSDYEARAKYYEFMGWGTYDPNDEKEIEKEKNRLRAFWLRYKDYLDKNKK